MLLILDNKKSIIHVEIMIVSESFFLQSKGTLLKNHQTKENNKGPRPTQTNRQTELQPTKNQTKQQPTKETTAAANKIKTTARIAKNNHLALNTTHNRQDYEE